MQILSSEEAKKFGLKKAGPEGIPVIAELRKLDVGQSLLVQRTEWPRKTRPGVLIPGCFRDGRKFSIQQISDNSGWLMTRKS